MNQTKLVLLMMQRTLIVKIQQRNCGYDGYQRKFKRIKFCTRFKDNILAADLATMESYSSKNKNVKYLLCAIDVFSKYACVKPSKDKRGETVHNKSNFKPKKIMS